MMNKAAAAFGVLLFCSVLVLAQTNKESSELRSLLDGFLVGAAANDVKVHDRFWADDLVYTRAAGTRIGKSELMKGVMSAPRGKADAPVMTYKAEDVQIRLYGNTAVVAFRLVSTTAKMDGSRVVDQFLNTGTFVKRKGRWQAVAWQATAIPKQKN